MSTTFKTLYQKVFLRIPTRDGRTLLAVKEGVNLAQRAIARVKDFDELMTWDTANATTANGTKRYHLVDDLGLSSPKDIVSIKLMDDTNSRKLRWINPRELDRLRPYPEGDSNQRSTRYTQRGNYIELFPIPDDTYELHIYHSKWPTVLVADTDNMDYSDEMEDVIVALATEVASSILAGETVADWTAKAKEMLGLSVREHSYRPDRDYVARPFESSHNDPYTGEYWKDPFIKGVR